MFFKCCCFEYAGDNPECIVHNGVLKVTIIVIVFLAAVMATVMATVMFG